MGRRGRHLRCDDEALFDPFLLFHPSVLEPDFDLGLVQLEGGGNLYPPRSSEVFVEVELFLELRELFVGEVGAAGVVQVEEWAGQHLCASGGAQPFLRATQHALVDELRRRDHQLWRCKEKCRYLVMQ